MNHILPPYGIKLKYHFAKLSEQQHFLTFLSKKEKGKKEAFLFQRTTMKAAISCVRGLSKSKGPFTGSISQRNTTSV